MRLARPATGIAIAVLALAGCTSADPGWTYAPPPSDTPLPSVAPSGEPGSPAPSAPASAAPSGQPSAAPSQPASAAPSGSVQDAVQVSAVNSAFEQDTLTVPADAAFQIEFANNDAGIPHNVEIKDPGGQSLFRGDVFPGVETRTYDAPALPAGPYQFVCTVHPNMIIEVTAG
jgi:plastocyanin